LAFHSARKPAMDHRLAGNRQTEAVL